MCRQPLTDAGNDGFRHVRSLRTTSYDSRMSRAYGLIFVLFLAVSAPAAYARASSGQLLLSQSVGISQDEAAASVREATGGRVLDVRTETQDGVAVYAVKVLLPDGRIRVVTVGRP